MIQSVLMVCIGNICRSPMAEALLIDRFNKNALMVSVHSAGIGALVSHEASHLSQELMTELGFDITAHRARQMTSEIAFGSELILTMTLDQQQQIEQQFPSTKGRVHRLGKWGGFDVPDPFQRPRVIYEQALALIEQGVDEWYRTLWV